jgi:hypothetical protein
MARFEADPAPPALKAEQPAMDTEINQRSPRVGRHGEDPFALTESCDYYPPSKVSPKLCCMSLELGFGTDCRKMCRPDLAPALAQTSNALPSA